MKKTLLLVLSVMLSLAAGNAKTEQEPAVRALFKSSGRSLQDSRSFRSDAKLKRIPTKAEVYGSNSHLQGHSDVCPSAPLFDAFSAQKAPRRAEGEQRTARALLIFNDTERATNRIIEMPITPGVVTSFATVAERVPKMPYKNYGEEIVTAVAFDNLFMASTYCDMLYSQTNSIYSTLDWKHQYDYDYRVADLEAPSLAYNPADAICYGIFQGINPATHNDEWFFGRWIDPSSYTIPEPIRWLGADTAWFGMAIAPDGTIYAIDSECNLITVDKTDGSTTLVGATGLTNKYRTSACYDAVNNRILFATSLDSGSAMNSIDPTTGRATMLYAMPDGEQIIGLFIPDAEAADKAPAAPVNLKASFELGSLSGNIEFDVPATYFDGTPASGTVDYEVSINGEVRATGTAEYGKTTAAPVTMEASGNYVVVVRLRNSAGQSPVARESLFCGTPKPRVPYFTSAATYNETEKCFELSWVPNPDVTGLTGGVVVNNELSYELIRYPDMKVISVEPGVCSLKDPYTPASDNLEIVYYDLCAIYHGTKSYYTRSSTKTFGTITPPFADDSMSASSAAIYSYISTATDTHEWSYIGPVTEQEKQHGWMHHGAAGSTTPMDSYLVMAPMKLQKGKVYTLSFTAACTNTSWRNERLAVYMGQGLTYDGLRQQTLLEPTLIYKRREENGERHSCNFTANADGLYYIAFHHCSDANLRYLYIADISISAPIDENAPAAVKNLSVQPATSGQLTAIISCDMPTKSINGNTLTETTKVRLYRNDELIADETPTGKSYHFTDSHAVNGVNNYKVIPYNSKGEGAQASINVFVGVGKPVNPQPYAWFGANDGQAEISWPSVAVDEFGTPLNGSNVSYEVQREAVLSSGATERTLIAQDVAGNIYLDQFCNPSDEQRSASYWIRAVTAGGTSQWVSTRKLGLGKPYTTPWMESFANHECEYNWHTVGTSMTWILTDDAAYDDVKSVDGDNGFFLAQAASAGTAGLLYSGAIAIPADMESPVFSFYYLNQDKYQGTPVKNFVEMVIIDSTGQHHVKKAVCNGPWGWQRLAYDMSAYKGQKVEVGVYLECIDRPFIGLDAFRLATRYQHDIDMVRVLGPETVGVGEDAVFTVSYENLGSADIPAGYKVQLYHGSRMVAETEGKAIKADGRESVNFTVTTNPAMGEKAEFHAVVAYDDDNKKDNNTSGVFKLNITNNIGYPEPRSLRAERLDNGVSLEWSEPDMSKTPRESYTENFEQFDSFAKEIPGWIILDEDKGIVCPISNYIQTPDTWGSPFGFFVQDGGVAPFNEYNEFATTSGTKYMASQFAADASGNAVQNDDWLISPELSGNRQTAYFMGKSISSSWPETFEVLYSATGTDKEDFISLGGVAGAPAEWIHYSVNLPEGARYFAIRCRSVSCLQFMVDDVTLRLKSCDPITLTMQGYNVYRDGKLVNPSPLSTLNFVDKEANSDEHSYMVTAVYKEGESTPSEAYILTSGLEQLGASEVIVTRHGNRIFVTAPDSRRVEIFSAAGACYHRGTGSCIVSVPSGVYVVKAGDRTMKVIVE